MFFIIAAIIPLNWFEFAQKIVANGKPFFPLQLETIDPIETQAYPTPAKRPLHSVLSTDKIQKAYGVQACAWEQALAQVVKEIHLSGELQVA